MRAAATLILFCAALAALAANALGFGRVSNTSLLGQPLNFTATLNLDANETLARECVAAEVFSGDNQLQPGQIRVTLEGNANARQRSVRVTSTRLIDEPVLTVAVTLGCTAKVTRRFVAFVNPPIINLARALPTAEGAALSAGAAPASRQANARPVASAVQPVMAPRAALKAAPGPPRLQLEATPPVVALAAPAGTEAGAGAGAGAGADAAPAAAAAASTPDERALAQERQRIVVLEDGLTRLRSDSLAAQKNLAALQARLKEAETERYANPLVYALAWLSGLLMLVVAALWWRQARRRTAARWWAAPAAASTVHAAGQGASAEPQPSESPVLSAPTADVTAFDVAMVTSSSERSGSIPGWVARTAAAPPPSPAPIEPVGELSVEELIDLEQQAEFFVVLGQDEAAIELLMSHVRSDGGISPLPCLKLLEIYRRRGESDAYERIRERFTRRFNAPAPDWDSDLQQGRSLEDDPDIIARLVALWNTPARAMETLEASLLRRNKADRTFDLPAYRELLFLYSIARDLAEHGASEPPGDVDLLLPMPESDAVRAGNVTSLPLDLDVSLGPTPHPRRDTEDTAPAALRLTPDHRAGAESGFPDVKPGDAKPATPATAGPVNAGKAGKAGGPASGR
jgi:pilus assembly protein FimV